MQRKAFYIGSLCVLVGLASAVASAGTLRIGTATVQGDNVTIPVLLDGDVGGGVAAADFKFTYDPAVLEPVDTAAGAAATAAGKQVQTNIVEPGLAKVVMFSLSNTTVPSGEVAQITMRKIGTSGTTDVSVVEPSFSDPNAVQIPSTGSSETLRLDAGKEEKEEQETEKPEENSQNEQENTPEPTPETPGAAGIPSVGSPTPEGAPGTPKASPGGTAAPGDAQVVAVKPGDAPDRSAAQRLAKALEAADQARSGVPTPATPETGIPPAANADATLATPNDTTETPIATLETATSTSPTPPASAAIAGSRQKVAALSPGSSLPVQSVATPPTTSAESSSSKPWIWMLAVGVVIVGLFLVRRKLFS